MVRWRADLRVEDLVERLRLDAIKWKVFDWKNAGLSATNTM